MERTWSTDSVASIPEKSLPDPARLRKAARRLSNQAPVDGAREWRKSKLHSTHPITAASSSNGHANSSNYDSQNAKAGPSSRRLSSSAAASASAASQPPHATGIRRRNILDSAAASAKSRNAQFDARLKRHSLALARSFLTLPSILPWLVYRILALRLRRLFRLVNRSPHSPSSLHHRRVQRGLLRRSFRRRRWRIFFQLRPTLLQLRVRAIRLGRRRKRRSSERPRSVAPDHFLVANPSAPRRVPASSSPPPLGASGSLPDSRLSSRSARFAAPGRRASPKKHAQPLPSDASSYADEHGRSTVRPSRQSILSRAIGAATYLSSSTKAGSSTPSSPVLASHPLPKSKSAAATLAATSRHTAGGELSVKPRAEGDALPLLPTQPSQAHSTRPSPHPRQLDRRLTGSDSASTPPSRPCS